MTPDHDYLLKILRYDGTTGKLFWKTRTLELFNSPKRAASWNTKWAGKEAFTSVDAYGYQQGRILNKRYVAHRIIFKMVFGYDPCQVDHIDGDPQNNVLSNLREVTHKQNGQNQKRPSRNTSGVIGVSWDSATSSWKAQIRANGKNINLGRFKNKDDAVEARQEAERQYGFHRNHGR